MRRTVKLKDLEAVKWVTGLLRENGDVVRLTAEQIAEIAEIEMIQPYLSEPNTWGSVQPTERYFTVMAIVATEYSERGAELVRADKTVTARQNDLLAVGEYAQQQKRLCTITGACSEGCTKSNTKLRTVRASHGIYIEHVCRHTLRSCKSTGDASEVSQRLELLERLRVKCRELAAAGVHHFVVHGGFDAIRSIIDELDGVEPTALAEGSESTEPK